MNHGHILKRMKTRYITLQSHNSPKIFVAFVQILLNVNLSLNQTLLTFLFYLRQTWMTLLFWQSRVIFLKEFCYSYAWSCSFCEGRTYIFRSLIFIKLCRILLMFSTYFTSLSRIYFRLFLLPDNSSKNSILN